MSDIVPLLLEIDEPLTDGEEMIGVVTIGVDTHNGRGVGYVAMIKNFNTQDHLNIRYGNLRAVKLIGTNINNKSL